MNVAIEHDDYRVVAHYKGDRGSPVSVRVRRAGTSWRITVPHAEVELAGGFEATFATQKDADVAAQGYAREVADYREAVLDARATYEANVKELPKPTSRGPWSPQPVAEASNA